jgi:hypothetical protein
MTAGFRRAARGFGARPTRRGDIGWGKQAAKTATLAPESAPLVGCAGRIRFFVRRHSLTGQRQAQPRRFRPSANHEGFAARRGRYLGGATPDRCGMWDGRARGSACPVMGRRVERESVAAQLGGVSASGDWQGAPPGALGPQQGGPTATGPRRFEKHARPLGFRPCRGHRRPRQTRARSAGVPWQPRTAQLISPKAS